MATTSYAPSSMMTEVKGSTPEPEYKTRTFSGKGGNISMAKPGGGSLNRRATSSPTFQKARQRRK